MSGRGMKKWAPYKSLPEQWSSLDEQNNNDNRVEKPKISNEMAEEINEILTNYQGQELTFIYFKKGSLLEEKSTIKKIDAFERKLILDNRRVIYLRDLVEIK